jgi:hypothetical protein
MIARLARRVDTIAHGLGMRPAPGDAGGPRRPRASLVGAPAAGLSGVDPGGVDQEITLRSGGRHLVAFLTSSCAPCQTLWTAWADGARPPAGTRLVIVTPEPALESRRAVAALAPAGADVVMSSRAWFDYGVRGAPWFALVVDGVIKAEGHAGSWPEVDRLGRGVG